MVVFHDSKFQCSYAAEGRLFSKGERKVLATEKAQCNLRKKIKENMVK